MKTPSFLAAAAFLAAVGASVLPADDKMAALPEPLAAQRTDVEQMEQLLGSIDPADRERAVKALAARGPEAAAPLARIAGTTSDYWARRGALEALRLLGPDAAEDAGPTVATLASRFKTHAATREQAVEVLEVMGYADAAPALVAIMQEQLNPNLKSKAQAALISFGAPSAPALAEALRGNGRGIYRERVAQTLERLGPDAAEAVPALIESLENAPRNVQSVSSYLKAGRELTQEEMAHAVYEAYDVRLAAMKALGAIGPAAAEAVPALTEALSANPDAQHAAALADALKGIGAPAALEALPALRASRERHVAGPAARKLDAAIKTLEGASVANTDSD